MLGCGRLVRIPLNAHYSHSEDNLPFFALRAQRGRDCPTIIKKRRQAAALQNEAQMKPKNYQSLCLLRWLMVEELWMTLNGPRRRRKKRGRQSALDFRGVVSGLNPPRARALSGRAQVRQATRWIGPSLRQRDGHCRTQS